MRIWVIGRGYPAEKNQMLGSFELEQAHMLSAEHEVYYPVVEVSLLTQPAWSAKTFSDGKVTVVTYSIPTKKIRGLRRAVKSIGMRAAFRSLEKRFGLPDVIHIHYPCIEYVVCTLRKPLMRYKSKGVKIVCTEHWTKVQTKEIGEKFQKGLRWFAENADAFICVGEPLRQSVLELTGGEHEIRVIPNVVDKCFFETGKSSAEKSCFRFIAVGRLVPVKQFDKLIEAFAAAFKDEPGVRLMIVGGGEMRETLAAIIERLGMRDRIELTGTKSREEVAQHIADSDVLVCPSRLETFGVPAAEAMACGKPFIGTEALSFWGQIPAGCGILVDSQSQDELVKALIDSYENIEQFDSKAAIRAAKELFSEEAVRDRLNRLYTSL